MQLIPAKQHLLVVLAFSAANVPAFAVDDLAGRFRSILAEHGVVGGACVIIRADQIGPVICYGSPTIAQSRPVGPQTRFRAGSVSKTLTSLLTLRLAERGVIELDRPIERQSEKPRFRNPWGRESPLTLAHLLEHTGGFAGSSYRDYATSIPDATGVDFFKHAGVLSCRWPPGTFYSYSNNGYGLLGALLERIGDRTFDELMEEEVFGPLGVTTGSFLSDGGRGGGAIAEGHSAQGVAQPTWAMPARPAGSLVIAPRDLARVVQMLILRGELEDGSEFLPSERIDRMERSEASLAARAGVTLGAYGQGQFGFAIDGRIWQGHWGKTDGFLTNFGYLPEHGVGFVVMINTDLSAAMADLRALMSRHLAGGLPGPPRPTVRPIRVGDDATGRYVNVTHDMPLRDWLFRMLDQKAIAKMDDAYAVTSVGPHGSSTDIFRPTGDGAFISESLPVPTAALVDHAGYTYWVDGEAYQRVTRLEAELRRWGFMTALAVAAGTLVATPFGWLTRRLRASEVEPKQVEERHARWRQLAAIAASLGLLISVALFLRFALFGSAADLRLVGTPSWLSVAMAVATISFGLGALAYAALSINAAFAKRRVSDWVRLIAALPLAGVALHWIASGWVPLVTWL